MSEPLQLSIGDRGLVPRTMAEMTEFAGTVFQSGLAPTSFKTPQQVFIAMCMLLELRQPLINGLARCAVINGRAVMWGDSLLALVISSGKLETWQQGYRGVPFNDDYCAWVKVTRKGQPPHESTFSVRDAKDGKLWEKPGPWQQFAPRMLLSRCRAFALRDMFPDVLMGMRDAEEETDIRDGAIEAETTKVDVPPVKLGQAAPAAALSEAEKTVHLAPRQARQTETDLNPASKEAPAAEQKPATDYRAAIVKRLAEHPTQLSEEDFMHGLRGIGKTTRPGATLEGIAPDKLEKLHTQLDNLLNQIVDWRAKQSDESGTV